MALYEIIADDACGTARIATRKRVDAAAALAWAWCYDQLGGNGLRDRPVAYIARNAVYDFERFAPGLGAGTHRRMSTGGNSYVTVERVA